MGWVERVIAVVFGVAFGAKLLFVIWALLTDEPEPPDYDIPFSDHTGF